MKKTPRLVIAAAAALLLPPAGRASSPLSVTSVPAPSGEAAAKPYLDAIAKANTSHIVSEPKCGDGTTLTGAFVMETKPRPGFPLDATTFASPKGTFTSVTTTGDESEAVIAEIAKTLNKRADNYVKKLLRNCSL
jgi:hypothetical protein